MKELEKIFVKNCDKCGNHTFTQLRKDGNVYLYRRNRMDSTFHSFEVFVAKTVLAGSPLPNGTVVEEDYIQYPGASAFGRTAWSISGKEEIGLMAANRKFNAVLKRDVVVEVEEPEIEADDSVPVVRVISTAPIKEGLKLPNGEFSQKELAKFNGFDNYKVVYSDLQKMLARGILKRGSVRPATRGKPAQLFVRA